MHEERVPAVTSVVVPGEETPGLEEPIVVTAEETPTALAIRDGLLSEAGLGGADLEVRIEDDRAVISGDVRTEEQRELALDVAGRHVGRDRVVDRITSAGQIELLFEA